MAENGGLSNRKVIVVLKRPTSVNPLITYYKGIYSSMSNNEIYDGSEAKLGIFNTDIGDLVTKQAGFKAKPQLFLIADRDAAVDKAYFSSEALKLDVQGLCNANIPAATTIATGANMSAKIITARGKQKNSWAYGNESGVLHFLAEGKGPHQWQSSDDGEKWVNDDPTNDANKTYPNETPDTERWYRNRQILPKGLYGPWSTPFKISIK